MRWAVVAAVGALGACTNPAVTVATHQVPRGLALDATRVYWSDASAGTIQMAPRGGGAAKLLATVRAYPYGVIVDATNAYWIEYPANGAQIVSVALDGSGLPTIVGPSAMFPFGTFASNGTTLVQVSGTSEIVATPVGGGPTTMLAQAGGVAALAIDATNVYYASGTKLWSVSIAGGTPTLLYDQMVAIGHIQTVAIDAEHVYWIDTATSQTGPAVSQIAVHAMPLAGGAPTTLVPSTPFYPGPLVASASHLYWLTQAMPDDPIELVRMPLGGGSVTTFAQHVAGDFGLVAAAAGEVSWAGEDGSVQVERE